MIVSTAGIVASSNNLITKKLVEADWKNTINASFTVDGSGNILVTKVSGTNGWGYCGPSTIAEVAAGECYVECEVNSTGHYKMFGLSNGDVTRSYTDIDFAIYQQTGNFHVYQNGALRFQLNGSLVLGDILKVHCKDGVVKYYQNDVLRYTSLVAPSYPLLVDTAIYNNNQSLMNLNFTGKF